MKKNAITEIDGHGTFIDARTIVIVGAGAIGMEFAYVLRNYGVEVTVIGFLDRALPNEDAEVSKEITRRYKKLGISILTSTKVATVSDNGTSVTITHTAAEGNGEHAAIRADKVLMSVGFAPRSSTSGVL